VIAATLARNDFVGAVESVEGKHGLLVGYSDDAHPTRRLGLGSTYETMKIGVKPYPSCATLTPPSMRSSQCGASTI